MGLLISLLISVGITILIYVVVKRKYGDSVRFFLLDEGKEALQRKLQERREHRESETKAQPRRRPVDPREIERDSELSHFDRLDEVAKLEELYNRDSSESDGEKDSQ